MERLIHAVYLVLHKVARIDSHGLVLLAHALGLPVLRSILARDHIVDVRGLDLGRRFHSGRVQPVDAGVLDADHIGMRDAATLGHACPVLLWSLGHADVRRLLLRMTHSEFPHKGRHVRILVGRIQPGHWRPHVRDRVATFLLRGSLIVIWLFLVDCQLLRVDLECVIGYCLVAFLALGAMAAMCSVLEDAGGSGAHHSVVASDCVGRVSRRFVLVVR